jgi:hypothetical protein
MPQTRPDCPISEGTAGSIPVAERSQRSERLSPVGVRKDFANGAIWDPEHERYLVEVRLPDGSRKKKRFRRQREAQRWWTLCRFSAFPFLSLLPHRATPEIRLA